VSDTIKTHRNEKSVGKNYIVITNRKFMYIYIVYHLNNFPVLSSFMTYHLVCN